MSNPPCAETDPEVWFRKSSIGRAKGLCQLCPIREACLDIALEAEASEASSWGVYGGLSADERRALLNDPVRLHAARVARETLAALGVTA